ncbi:MAG: MarR family transcriptional regulator [Myxococcales bacterium]|nr:MarR family transcriptional regulator [Myxococcales bacterium]
MGVLKPELDRIVETIIFLVTESRRLAREVAARHGVTPTQLSVLKLLREIGDLKLGDLSRRIQAQNSTVTGIVDRMEEAGLVLRSRSADDRRVWTIALTEQGRAVAEGADVGPWETLRAALSALPRADKRKLVEILNQVAGNVARSVAGKRATTGLANQI